MKCLVNAVRSAGPSTVQREQADSECEGDAN